MTEREYMSRLSLLFNKIPGVVFRVMPDTGGCTHKKPYDAFMIYKGRHFSLEGKCGNGESQPHQHKALREDLLAGAKCFVIRCDSTGATFLKYTDAGEGCQLSQIWQYFRTDDGCKEFLHWMDEI